MKSECPFDKSEKCYNPNTLACTGLGPCGVIREKRAAALIQYQEQNPQPKRVGGAA